MSNKRKKGRTPTNRFAPVMLTRNEYEVVVGLLETSAGLMDAIEAPDDDATVVDGKAMPSTAETVAVIKHDTAKYAAHLRSKFG